MGTASIWLFSLILVAVVSLIGWYVSYSRARFITDTPTSKTNSAAQGYVELFGRAEQLPGQRTVSKLTGLPCVWFRYSVEERRNDRWYRIDSGQSEERFLLRDDVGCCVIDPEYAQVITTRNEVWHKDGYRLTQYVLHERDTLYALGELATIGGAGEALDSKQDLNRLIEEWKQDRSALLSRFDLDGDGHIDLKEWELARAAAIREVRQKHQRIRSEQATLILRQPRDGRLFLLANLPPQVLARRYLWWNRAHLFTLLFSATGLMYCLYRLGVR
jgi:hypothetical protein